MSSAVFPHRFCVAPMLDWTDRHDRYFLRLISRSAVLYTEMVTSHAILHGDQDRHLAFDASEHPVALQLGGSEPEDLARCAKIAADYGYDEINLNIGCPSDRVQSGRFGACLMAEPELVADCVAAMQAAVDIPVTVKSRIGIDHQDDYPSLQAFIARQAAAGCRLFIVHARKAWLQGLSPKQNREIPPLHYDYVYRLKQDFPDLDFVINGGIQNLDEVDQHLQHVDGVMLGRQVYHEPYTLAEVDQRYAGSTQPIPTRMEVLEAFLPYVEAQLSQGQRLQSMTRHILGLFQGLPGARRWRRHLSENAYKKEAGPELILAAARWVTESPAAD